jgi:hypothetical protein
VVAKSDRMCLSRLIMMMLTGPDDLSPAWAPAAQPQSW